MKSMPKYEFEGEMLTAREIADRTGLNRNLISRRLFDGKRGKALTEPPVSLQEAARRGKAKMRNGGTIITAKAKS